jgi:hypothetical protein
MGEPCNLGNPDAEKMWPHRPAIHQTKPNHPNNKMKQVISISIDLSKIDKTAFYVSPSNGKKYMSLMLKIREEKDQYGYDGFIVQEVSKERKATGEKGPILGNAKIMEWNQPIQQPKPKAPVTTSYADEDDDIPF